MYYIHISLALDLFVAIPRTQIMPGSSRIMPENASSGFRRNTTNSIRHSRGCSALQCPGRYVRYVLERARFFFSRLPDPLSIGSTPFLTVFPAGEKAGGGGKLLRRNFVSGGTTYMKRRAMHVPQLSLVFRVLATMVFDTNLADASAAKDPLLDLVRNDPGLFLRPNYICSVTRNKKTTSTKTFRRRLGSSLC